jgi:hypothetical protein
MKTENFIKCYEVLREELGNLCKWNCEIWDMEQGKRKVTKSYLKKEKANFALSKERFRGMCDMANLTGEFAYPLGGQSGIDSEFGWFFE